MIGELNVDFIYSISCFFLLYHSFKMSHIDLLVFMALFWILIVGSIQWGRLIDKLPVL